MQITITNAGAVDLFVSLLYKQLVPGESVVVSKSRSELDQEQEFKKLVEAGTLVLGFATEDGDDAQLGTEPWPSFSDASRPAPADWPIFSAIWNVSDTALNWSDGAAWRDAAGVIT